MNTTISTFTLVITSLFFTMSITNAATIVWTGKIHILPIRINYMIDNSLNLNYIDIHGKKIVDAKLSGFALKSLTGNIKLLMHKL